MTPGATPKQTKSDNESSCAPKGEVLLSSRAIRPSRPSKTPATMMAITAHSNLPLIAKRIAVMPAHSASSVRMFGIIRLSDRPVMRRGRRKFGGRSIVNTPSMCKTLARRLLRAAIGDHRLATDDALSGDDERDPSGGQVYVRPAAESNNAETLPDDDILALAQIADDTAGDQAGDLHDRDIARVVDWRDADRHALVVLACLVEAGIDEFAFAIAQLGDAAADRDAVDVDVEDIEEDADARHRGGAHIELGRRHRWGDREDAAIGGTDHQSGALRRHPPGVAKEIGAPHRQHQPDPTE